jgi:hypothetical protein
VNPLTTGYDAVILIPRDESNPAVVRFIQITRAKEHDLKLKSVRKLASAVKHTLESLSGFRVEIVFIIPSGQRSEFKITSVLQPKSLSRFEWPTTPAKIISKLQYVYTDHE